MLLCVLLWATCLDSLSYSAIELVLVRVPSRCMHVKKVDSLMKYTDASRGLEATLAR